MKKFRIMMLTVLTLLLFSGCKQQTQQEFSEELIKQSERNAGDFSLRINQVDIEAKDAEESTRTRQELLAKMISGTKISGDYQQQRKQERLALNLSVDGLGQELPIQLFVDEKQPSVYLSTDFMTDIATLAKEFNSELPFEPQAFEQLQGKYLHLDEQTLEQQAEGAAVGEVRSGDFDFSLMSEYLATLEADSFETKADTIKRTFTKTDIQQFIKYVKENGDKSSKQVVEEGEKMVADLSKYRQTTTVNTKKHTQKTVLTFTLKNDDAEVSADVTLTSQAKDSNQEITWPKAADTLSLAEFQKIIEATQTTSETPISEEEFNELLAIIRNNGNQLTAEQIEALKEDYRAYLTEEQYKQFEAALKQAKETAA